MSFYGWMDGCTCKLTHIPIHANIHVQIAIELNLIICVSGEDLQQKRSESVVNMIVGGKWYSCETQITALPALQN
jgi:hypothetical protein